MINANQKQAVFNVVMILSSRNPSETETLYADRVKAKAPKLYARAEVLAKKVKENVANYMADTWADDLADMLEND